MQRHCRKPLFSEANEGQSRPQLDNSVPSQGSYSVVSVDSEDGDIDFPDINVLPPIPTYVERDIYFSPTFKNEDIDIPDMNSLSTYVRDGSHFPDCDVVPLFSPHHMLLAAPSHSQGESNNRIMPSVNDLEDAKAAFRSAALATASEKFRCNKMECQMDANEVGRPRLQRQQVLLSHDCFQIAALTAEYLSGSFNTRASRYSLHFMWTAGALHDLLLDLRVS